MEEYQEFKPAVTVSVHLNQQPRRRFRDLQEVIDNENTGFTPTHHVTMSELNNFPFETQPDYQTPPQYLTQIRVRPDQYTPLGQFFMNCQAPAALPVLDDRYVNENLSKEFSYQQL